MVDASRFLICLLLPFFSFPALQKKKLNLLCPPAKIAVVLGAGASKGFAHIGVLKVLESNKIPVHMIVGTSAGSFVGSLYAYGYNAFDLQKLSFSIEKGDVIDLAIPDNGFIKGEKLEEYVNRTVRNTPLEKLKIPFMLLQLTFRQGGGCVRDRQCRRCCKGKLLYTRHIQACKYFRKNVC